MTVTAFDEYFPFDVGHGYPANTARWRKMAQLWQADGVFAGYLNQLSATPLTGVSGTVTVATGGVFVHGYYGEIQSAKTITVGTSGTIVAGVDLSGQTVSIYYRDTVVDYGSNPASNYEQDTSKWEIPLWLVSSGSLIDLRTMVNPGAACNWWTTVPGPVNIASGVTLNQQIGTIRVPYAGQAILSGQYLLTYSDSSSAQSAPSTLVYQNGVSDVQTTPTITPTQPGGGPSGQPSTEVVALSGQISITQGKKTVGWRVTAGTGPQISIATMIVQVQIVSVPGAA